MRGKYLERSNEKARQMVAVERLDIVGGVGRSLVGMGNGAHM